MGAAHHRGSSEQSVETPKDFITAVKNLLGIDEFTIDLAASVDNAQAKQYITEEQNSLSVDWTVATHAGWGWLNPPYDNIAPWAEKCAKHGREHANIALLVPASVGSNWYRDFVHRQASVLFLNKRVQFVGHKYPYPKDLLLAIYGPYVLNSHQVWDWKANKFY